MAFPTTTHATSPAAHADLLNAAISAGYTPNAALDLESILYSLVANLLQSLPAASGVRIYTATIDPASVAANTTAEQTFTVTGLTTSDVVFVNKPTATAGLGIVNARVTAANTLGITFSNNTGSPIDAASESYKVFAFRA